MNVNHVAFLTHELESITSQLPDFCRPLSIENQPSEGTREQYVEFAGEGAPRLLLMQPVAEGPYRRAMRKRGPGLHHIGGAVESIRELLPRIEQHRLLVHPASVTTFDRKMLWLCRPGVPFLIEVLEDDCGDSENVMCSLRIPPTRPIPKFIRGFFSNLDIQNSDDDRFYFGVGNRIISFNMAPG